MKKQKHLTLSLLILCSILISCGSNSQNELDYVALGASDATGIGATPITNGYPYLIQKGLEKAGTKKIAITNLGIPGAEIADIDNLEVQLLKLNKPDLVTITTGSNDLIDGDNVIQFESDLKGLLGKLRSISPDVIIAIGNVPNLTKVERFVESPDTNVTLATITAYNKAIERQALAFDARVVDLFNVQLNDSLTSAADGFHPNDRGHQAMADSFLELLVPLVKGL